ncbi:(d)CMP kinase [Flagellimonas sp. DF-77]|uniref:(d)CMP kinase n=1 Tax=Flagellimonas algarum TaxID=3230298 RepID=UPI0033996DDC
MHKITIAIDGYSSTGKSTIAKQLANALGYVYVDTGAMYRAITWWVLNEKIAIETEAGVKALLEALPDLNLQFKPNSNTGRSDIYLNGENLEPKIRTMEVSRSVSKVATIEAVREQLVAQQQKMGLDKAIVMDGRDIGTVVFPDAELKIFMTASPETRAHRRYKELLDRGEQVSYNEVLMNVKERDYIDSHRKVSPLRRADDAIEFDNSDMGLEEQFERIHNFALRIIDKQ